MGIPLEGPAATAERAELRDLALRARAGDKQAQYDLGLRFARGEGVAQDCKRARKIFRRAAAKSGGMIWVYSPPVAKGGSGRVISVNSGPERPGLAKAHDALEIEGFCRSTAGLGHE